jgi:hypothetical protein
MPLSRLISFAAAFVEQLAMLDIKPGDQDSAANSITALKNELDNENKPGKKPKWTSRPFPGRLKN